MYAVDGSINCVVVQSSATPQGLYHACGAMRVVEATSEYGVYAPNGAFYVSGASYSILMAGSETDVLTMASIDDTMTIRSTSDPTDDYQGTPGSKLTTTRASTATYWDVNGILQSAATGTLRRDYDPRLSSTTERCGYLIEEARTNLALRSEDFGNAAWTKSELTVSSDAGTAPDGSSNFDKLIPSTNAANHTAIQSPTTTAAAYTMSFFAKAAGYNFIYCRLYNNDGSPLLKGAWFNLGTGAVGTTETGITASITSVGNGIYRCVATLATAYNGAGNSLILGVSNADNTTSFTGDGTSGVLLFGAQLELGSFASSYIPTTTATVTRAADLVTLAGTLFPLNQSEGTLYAKAAHVAISGTHQYVLSLDDGTLAERINLYRYSTGSKAAFAIYDGSSSQLGTIGLTSTASISALTQYKLTGAYKLNDSACALVGETVQGDIVCTMPTTTTFAFGSVAGGQVPLNGWLFEAAYYPTRKSNADLAVLAAAA